MHLRNIVHSLLDNAVIFGAPLALLIGVYALKCWYSSNQARRRLQLSHSSGLGEPVSLHPQINSAKCIGCAACVRACPEGNILGLINRKAALLAPTECIGHGACREACPSEAITLVFGSATRGVDIPLLTASFESSLPGVYIAGELGGMGLIRNAIIQGIQAMEAIQERMISQHGCDYDVVIVGAGPAGLSAALEASKHNLKFCILEQDSIGGTLAHYPRGKLVMTQPAELPIVGKFQFQEAQKDDLVDFWYSVIDKTGLKVETDTRVESLLREPNGFTVQSTKGNFFTHKVLLALGRRGSPRKLNVRGEELHKVVYRLVDPEQYRQQHVLVVGGGDSATEAAIAISGQLGTTVTLIYRGKSLSRPKFSNREKLQQCQESGKINVMLSSKIVEIHEHKVTISGPNGQLDLQNDSVIICVGGLLPTPFLHKSGIEVEAKFGTA